MALNQALVRPHYDQDIRMPQKELKYSILSSDSGRVDLVVARLLGFSRARVRGLIDHSGVTINDELCTDGGVAVHEGDALLLQYDPQRKYQEKPKERATRGFQVLYKDDAVVVVNKESGILTVPTDRRETNSLVDILSSHLNHNNPRRQKVSVVHRLDRDTSGLLIFGQTKEYADIIIKQFAARKPEREYAAIVAGVVAKDKGTIESFLQTDKALNQKSGATGEHAITHFEVRARYANATLVSVKLETGRRNQIRVHFAEMGHPVLGDTRYDAHKAAHAGWPYKRLALHARILGFNHPVDGRPLRFEQELPREFKSFSEKRK
ncbi:MAG: RluA family pseudouridine synthase [Chitinophagaceae bacterium]|nr:RluA family pseudouridine synthase [Oligoflexus sp.]